MRILLTTAILVFTISCSSPGTDRNKLEGTWRLLSGTTIQDGDTTVTDYTVNRSMIKIINQTHFAFVNHDVGAANDSTRFFGAGGGRYKLSDDKYTEFLEYCSDREWEGHQFEFTINISGDTLVQTGIEKVEGAGIDRLNIEKYVREASIGK